MWQIDILSIVRKAVLSSQNIGILLILMIAVIVFLIIYTISKNKNE